jgi:hypothetical protein
MTVVQVSSSSHTRTPVIAWIDSLKLVTDAVAAAAASVGASPEEVTELLGRLDGVSAIGHVAQAQVVRVLVERGRSMAEIELIVPELGKLATLHATDIVPWRASSRRCFVSRAPLRTRRRGSRAKYMCWPRRPGSAFPTRLARS